MSSQIVEALSLWKGMIRYRPRVGMRELAEEICARHELTFEELVGKSSARYIAWPRQEFMARAYALGHLSYPQIGRFLNRDHSTCIFGAREHLKRIAGEHLT